ncbi:MAG: hypothetical protein FWG29_06215 [Treponema sp.]|nr:hypothetical protein [Treponema sp.]
MTIEQIVDIPADYRISLELPHSIPTGVKARIEISFPVPVQKDQSDSMPPPQVSQTTEIEDVRQLLQKEMTEKGTSAIMATAGDGWETHVREHYAES